MTQRLLPLLAVSGALLGCAPLLRHVTAEPEDYEAYRRTRVAPTLEERLTHGLRYLRERPEGRFRDDVTAWFRDAEARYYERAQNDVARLEAYLVALPRGPHAAQAAERLAELRLAQRYVRRREHQVLEEAREVQERLSDAERMRLEFISEIKGWVARLAAIRSWGGRTHELDHELIYHFRLREPPARCRGDVCVKTLILPYAIPEERRLRARRALFDVELTLHNGGVAAARLTGPELFSRLGEALFVAPVSPSGIQARTEAVARVVQLVSGAVEKALPASRCAAEAVSPIVLARECDGVRLEVVAAPGGEQEDQILVRPVQKP